MSAQQSSDFANGNFVEATVWPVIKEHITALLLNPAHGFNVNGQTTEQWEIKRARNPDIFSVTDNRDIPDRRGDVKPTYIVRLCWLTRRDFDLVQHIWRCSVIYDRIKASLYCATPNLADRRYNNPQVRPWDKDRFIILMVTPDKWWIQDAFLKQIFLLADHLAWDISFDIGRWFEFNASVKEYESQDAFYEVIGLYYSPAATEECNFSDLWGSATQSPVPTVNVISEDHRDLGENDEQDANGESQLPYSVDTALLHRSPRPYAVGPEKMHSPIALGDRGLLRDDVPDLIWLDEDLFPEHSSEDEIKGLSGSLAVTRSNGNPLLMICLQRSPPWAMKLPLTSTNTSTLIISSTLSW